MPTVDLTNHPNVSATFVHPCLTCGATVHVVDTQEQPHDCVPADSPSAAIAKAWWAGYDQAQARCVQLVEDATPKGHDWVTLIIRDSFKRVATILRGDW